MKKIGILGGIAWPSTAAYCTGLCRLAQGRADPDGAPEMPEISIESLDLSRAAALLGHDPDEASWLAFDDYHRAGLQRLEHAGAAFAVIACNTAHHRLAGITRGLGLPVLSMLDAAADACLRLGIRRLLILGTATVMASEIFREAFERRGIDAFGPPRRHQAEAVQSIIQALGCGPTGNAARRIGDIAAEVFLDDAPPSSAVYLGCTELPLAFATHEDEVFESGGVRYLDSTALHVRAAFDRAVAT